MDGRAELGGFPIPFLCPRSAKMARNGGAQSGRCSSCQWGAADWGIGRAPALSLGEGWGWRAPCTGQSMAEEYEEQDAGAKTTPETGESGLGAQRPAARNTSWHLHSRGRACERALHIPNSQT